MELLLLKYGYLLVFAGVIVEGEAFLFAGAFLASRGYFNLPTIALVALAANTLSAQFYYSAARVRGPKWFASRFPEKSAYRKIIDWVSRHNNTLLLLSRFLFGFRMIIPAACGAIGMPLGRFAVLNLMAGIMWVIPTALVGYYFGENANQMLQNARHYTTGFLLVIGIGVSAFLASRNIRQFRSIFQNLEWSDLHNVIPFVMGSMGVLNIMSAIWPSSENLLRSVRDWLPLEVSQGSRTLMLFTGVALLQVTRNLKRRKQLAWYVAVIALSASLLLHLTSGYDVQNSLVAAMLLAYLIYFRRRFYTRSDPASLRKGLMATPLLLLIVFFYGLTGFEATYPQFNWDADGTPATETLRDGILIVRPQVVPMTRYASLFLNSLQIAGWMARIYILVLILRPVILRDRLEAPKADIERIFRQFGRQSVAAFAVQPDKHHLLVAKSQGLVAYAWKGSIALACGDPIAPDELFREAVGDYVDHCQRHGWMPCAYLAAEERLAAYQYFRFQSLRVAEEAIIDLQTFSPNGDNPVAMSVHRYERSRRVDPFIDEQLEEVTEDWLETRHMREMGFTVGHFSLEQLSEGPVFFLGTRHRVEAFCAWLPYKDGRAAVLDLVRQRRRTPSELVRAFLAHALYLLKESGFEEASLTAATIDRDQIETFRPRWETRYLVHPRGANVSKITKALTAIQKR
ncbi:MAG TPA: phosphatidylglycerol lysyltransferase domain-containing protein [Terriglobia bacterium]|nr:phosphatidylglycerol lysyltransferase domain-containing protein [Terriglobia bacterium]